MEPIIVENIAVNEKKEKFEKELVFLNEMLELNRKASINPTSIWQGEGSNGRETNEYHYRKEIILAIQKYNNSNEFNNQINKFEEIIPRITFLNNEIEKLPKPLLIHPLRPNNSSVLNLRPESTPQTLK